MAAPKQLVLGAAQDALEAAEEERGSETLNPKPSQTLNPACLVDECHYWAWWCCRQNGILMDHTACLPAQYSSSS